MSYEQILQATLSPDNATRKNAEDALKAYEIQDYSAYLIGLGNVLATEEADMALRISAGLAMKNSIKGNENLQEISPWVQVNDLIREQIKRMLLSILETNYLQVGQTASQAIAAIAHLEVPHGTWNSLVPMLMERASSNNRNSRLNCLNAFGLIFESVPAEFMKAHASDVLRILVDAINVKPENDDDIKMAAVKSLSASLDFIAAFFVRDYERNYIMTMLCQTFVSAPEELQIQILECITRIVSLYYPLLKDFFTEALAQMIVDGLKSDSEKVVLQALDFFTTVAEKETINDQLDDYEDLEEPPVSFLFTVNSLGFVLPTVLLLLCTQDEDADEHEWNPCKAASQCIINISRCVKNKIIDQVLPFVENNIQSDQWNQRNAAIISFGSIMEGPEANKIRNIMDQALVVVLGKLGDSNPQVVVNTSWTLSMVCEHCPDSINFDVHLKLLLGTIVQGLKSLPRIVYNSCWALICLSRHLSQNEAFSGLLQPYIEPLFLSLLDVSAQPDITAQSRTATYEALSNIIAQCQNDTLKSVETVAMSILGRLDEAIAQSTNAVDQIERENALNLQVDLFNVLNTIICTLQEDILPVADSIMQKCIGLLVNFYSPTTSEDIFICIGSMVFNLDRHFLVYSETFLPLLMAAINNTNEPKLCMIAIGMIPDICRIAGADSLKYLESFMAVLGNNLLHSNMDYDVQGAIFTCFGDLASFLGPNYKPFLVPSMQVLNSCLGQIKDSYHAFPSLNTLVKLLENILEAYSGFIQAFKESDKDSIKIYVGQIFSCLEFCAETKGATDDITFLVVGILGDLTEMFNSEIHDYLAEDWVLNYIKFARQSKRSKTRKLARWAKAKVNAGLGKI